MANATKIQLTSIVCHSTSEPSNDEVYLICQADAGVPIRYPADPATNHPMGENTTWTFNPPLELHFNYEVLITLWDQDVSYDPNLATYLVSNDYTTSSIPSSIRITNPNGADYTLNVSLAS